MIKAFRILTLVALLSSAARADQWANLLDWYKCQDNAASTAIVNSAAGGSNGALVNAGNTSASTTTGPLGAFPLAIQLDGTNDNITITDRSGVGGSDWTFSFRTKLDVATPADQIQTGFVTLGPVESVAASHYPFTDGTVYMSLLRFSANGTGNRISFAPAAVTRTDWHTITITTTPGANGWKFYVNGVQHNQQTGQTLYLDSDLWSVGRSFSGVTDYYLDGAVCDVRLYNRNLSAADVLEIHNFNGAMPAKILQLFSP
jgi:hypothetical protein